MGECERNFSELGRGQSAGCCEHGIELSGCINWWEFIDRQREVAEEMVCFIVSELVSE